MAILLIRVLGGILFCSSGILKLVDWEAFGNIIMQYHILPESIHVPATLLIPTLEVICGASLLCKTVKINLIDKSAVYVLTLLVGVFTIAVAINYYRGIDVDCGCFGALKIFHQISMEKILMNLVLLGLLIKLWIKDKHENQLHRELSNLFSLTLVVSLLNNIFLYNKQLIYSLNESSITQISFPRALDLVTSEEAVLLDARSIDKFQKSHVPGAISIPADNFEKYSYRLKEIPKSKKFLVYCDSKICGQAEEVTIHLIKTGYTKVYVIKEGFDG